MGRDHPNRDGHVRQGLGQQVRSCCGSLRGYHSPGTIPVAHIMLFPCSKIFTRLLSSSSALQVCNFCRSSFQSLYSRDSLGFGRRVTWTTDLVVPPDHQMTFKDALHISSTNLLVKLALPDWAKYLTKHTRKVDLAFTELQVCCSILSSRLS